MSRSLLHALPEWIGGQGRADGVGLVSAMLAVAEQPLSWRGLAGCLDLFLAAPRLAD